MPFVQYEAVAKPQIGEPISLQRANLDHATLILAFIYQELKHDGQFWQEVERQQVLVQNQHYSIDKRRGVIELLPDPFWQTEGLWRAADCMEPLLYKGQVKYPQRITFSYEHFAPEQVKVKSKLRGFGGGARAVAVRAGQTAAEVIDLDEIDAEAQARLGYDLPRYQEEAD